MKDLAQERIGNAENQMKVPILSIHNKSMHLVTLTAGNLLQQQTLSSFSTKIYQNSLPAGSNYRAGQKQKIFVC